MNVTEERSIHADTIALDPSCAGDGAGVGTDHKKDARNSKEYGTQQISSVSKEKLFNTDNDSLEEVTNCQRYGILVVVILVTFLGRAERTLISPFYAKYAVQRNVTEQEIGFVFGCLDFATLFSCITWSHFLYCINVKYIYTIGIVGTSLSSGLMSISSIIDNNEIFLGISIVFRTLMGLFSGAYFVAEAAILISLFSTNVASINAAIEAAAVLGYQAGPLIGGVLYQFGGFHMPFIVTSVCILVTGLSILSFLPSPQGNKETSQSSSCKMITIPVFMCCIAFDLIYMIVIAILYSFFSLHLEIYQLTTIGKSAVISSVVITAIISTLVIGRLLDKKPDWNVPLLIFVMSMFCVFVSLLGPAPYYNITDPPLWLVCLCWNLLAVLGQAGAVASIALAYQTAEEEGFPDTVETYGTVAGFIKASESLGSGIGAAIGGIMYQAMGWEWLLTTMAYMIGAYILTFLLAVGWKHLQKSKRNDESIIKYHRSTEKTALIN